MSRDFDLLQRIEQQRAHSHNLGAAVQAAVRAAAETDAADITEEPAVAGKRPTADIAPAIQNELTKLVQRVFLSMTAAKVVMFTGVEAGEGAKWITACAGEILSNAHSGHVCLLDADLQSPSLHQHFAIDNRVSLCDVLSKSVSIRQAAKRIGDNLWIVTSERKGSPAMTAISFQALVADLLDMFEYVLIAAPDCEYYGEIGMIGAAAQGAVLVLDATRTRRVAAQSAKQALDAANIRILGSVFNNRSFPIPQFLYSRL